ncbi:glycosyltransferase [Vibrio sp. WXL103]|uniref:glycosyltransferase n=1 Tax=Vibrio sp. WXL103 TaxID=3450710 RepID=UPI003EC57046
MTAVVVTYNRLAKLKMTIERYFAEANLAQLIIVNNASSDGTTEYLEQLQAFESRLFVINEQHNLGGAGGFHQGLKAARDQATTEWLVVSDDDSFPEHGALDSFFNLVPKLDPKCGWVASQVHYPEGGLCTMNEPMTFPSLGNAIERLLKRQKITWDPSLDARELARVDGSSFVGMFVNRTILQQTQVLPNRNYFLYWDDIAFCYDLAKQGVVGQYSAQVAFVHDCDRHTKSLEGQRLYYMVRNGIWTMAKLPMGRRIWAMPIKMISWLLIAIKSHSLSWYVKAVKHAALKRTEP